MLDPGRMRSNLLTIDSARRGKQGTPEGWTRDGAPTAAAQRSASSRRCCPLAAGRFVMGSVLSGGEDPNRPKKKPITNWIPAWGG